MANPLYDTLFGCHRGSGRTFLVRPDGTAMSYDDFLDLAARYAHALSALELAPGDRLALQVEKSPEALALYAACVQVGVIILPLNTAYTGAELAYFVENSGARLLVGDPADDAELAPMAEAFGARFLTLDAAGQGSFADLAAGQPSDFATVARDRDDLAAFLYTSGTTGRSKGAMMTQENLLSNALTLVDLWRFTEDDVLLHALPIFHTHGLFVATNVVLAAGASMIFLPKFDLEEVLRRLPQASSMMGCRPSTPACWAIRASVATWPVTCGCSSRARRRCWPRRTATSRPVPATASWNATG